GGPDESIVEFLTRYGLCAKANGWSDEKACYKLSTCLTGRALQVYLSLPDEVQGSYNAARVALLCRLITPPYQAAAALRDRYLKQGESVDSLLYELNKLYFEAHFVAPDLSAPDKLPSFNDLIKMDASASYHRDMILKVLDALPPTISSRLRVMKFTDVDELAYQARIELATQSYDTRRYSPEDVPVTLEATASPIVHQDQSQVEGELAALREQVAALTQAHFHQGQRQARRHRENNQNKPGDSRLPGRKWCIYHRTSTHWTSDCKAIARLAEKRELEKDDDNIDSKQLAPNGERAAALIAPSSSEECPRGQGSLISDQ
ncbi:hypothetical protein FOZ63_030128, partial [Perkinsus olseni]